MDSGTLALALPATGLAGVSRLAGLDDLRRLGAVAERLLVALRLRRLHHLRRFGRAERVVLLRLRFAGRTLGRLLLAVPLVRWLRSAHVGRVPP